MPSHCEHPGHLYYLLLPNLEDRTKFIETLKVRGIQAVFHYVPLGDSPAGKKYGRNFRDLPVTRRVADGLVRLPLWPGLEEHLDEVIDAVGKALSSG